MKDNLKTIKLSELHPFPENPFQVNDNLDFQQSIEIFGVLTPLLVRPKEEGGYEIVSGHRRAKACEKAGMESVPVVVRDMDRNAAIIALVDSNMHREHILPSEKAFAYKLKLEAIKHQGKAALSQVATKSGKTDSASIVGDSSNESRDQVFRYIRLTELIPELLEKVDSGQIAITPAIELSYLPKEEQLSLLETIESEDRTPSLSQAQRMKKLSAEGRLNMDTIFAIMTEEKPNQKEQIKLKTENIKEFFPKSYTAKQMEDTIMKLLAEWQRKRERNRGLER